jgi:hypothetical protein
VYHFILKIRLLVGGMIKRFGEGLIAVNDSPRMPTRK